ncbi:helix-turn-helix domain-containing protein [Winogradskyella pacifica]|uniref:helix-turn-helix domain-containing protein n=1 Tax=Winogradskyella pacifica TaxID=664642 RepID=UPI0015C885A5|nr:helix-turn-helix transcriptional regulator [Winogradskyella pacifica]
MVNKFLLKEFGTRIRKLRTQQNLSQEQLSFKTGFHRTYIGMIERGERNISLTNMAIFAKAFNLTVDGLLKFDNSEKLFKQYKLKTED